MFERTAEPFAKAAYWLLSLALCVWLFATMLGNGTDWLVAAAVLVVVLPVVSLVGSVVIAPLSLAFGILAGLLAATRAAFSRARS
jgi:uncharacterized protein with PQ loop repeat